MKRCVLFIVLGIGLLSAVRAEGNSDIEVFYDTSANARVVYGVERLSEALKEAGYSVGLLESDRLKQRLAKSFGESAKDRKYEFHLSQNHPPGATKTIVVGQESYGSIQYLKKRNPFIQWQVGKEGFALYSYPGGIAVVAGGDDSGVLYGCMELAKLVRQRGRVPENLAFTDGPAFVLRGPCIGMQKSQITYDGAQYDYRYTEENFPFFYDKAYWIKYLDMLVENRMNTVTLWNGHPFTSLLKLKRYPDAQELTDEQLAKNIAMFKWLTHEADRRGIWMIQFFYNIHMSHPLARKYGLPYLQHEPTAISREYTRYCIGEFVKQYPHVGLCMCLGEALHDEYDADWLCDVIIPGVKDAMGALGLTEEPPIIVRAHSTPAEEVMKAGLKIYSNLYTMHKWNQEVLAWTNVRGESRRIHESLAGLGSMHVVNVHLVSNITPFRWGSPTFIQSCMQTCKEMGAKGLHLYPQRYWNWPDSADVVEPPLKQIDRDWIWYEGWARYAWNPDREPGQERRYWIGRLAEQFGTAEAAEPILDAYESSGECAPMLIRRLGVTDGGRQVLSLGMQMNQLIHPKRYKAYRWLWECSAPPGERLGEWAKREWENERHEGETPAGVIEAAVRLSRDAVRQAESAGEYVTKHHDEYERFVNDMHCIREMSEFYAAKTRAAMCVLRYGYSKDIGDLRKVLPPLEESVEHYRRLAELTRDTYTEANSYFPDGSRIPFTVRDADPKHWTQCVGRYEQELANFKRNLNLLASGQAGAKAEDGGTVAAWPGAKYRLLTEGLKPFVVKKGPTVFADYGYDYDIQAVAGELVGLTGVRIPRQQAADEGFAVEFEVDEPVRVLVGYVEDDDSQWLQLPDVQAVAASGSAETFEPVLRNALIVSKITPAINVHAYPFSAGRHKLDLGKGAYLFLGVVPGDIELKRRSVGLQKQGLDWLFE